MMATDDRWRVTMLASFVVAACGGSASPDAPTDGALVDATIDASAEASTSSPCPASPSAAGSVCATEGLQCEYGTEWHVDCDVLMVCRMGRWQEEFDAGACAWRYEGADASCPAADGPPQGACAAGTQCEYANGHCDCAVSCGGPASPPDAGASWICTPPPQPRCSAMRPRLGEGCGSGASDAGCDYSLCCAGVSMTCVDGGYWQGTIRLGGCP